jgi:enoyl-CoA hydratase
MTALVSYALDDSIATITMDDGKANAFSVAMLRELHDAFDRAEADNAIVVLTGREGRLSGGFHLATLQGGGDDAVTMLRSGFELAVRMLTFPMPVVIACPGHAMAMASFVLLAADYRIGAAGPYKISANEVAIGLTMPWSAIEICRYRVNPSHFHRVLALAEVYSPETAVDAGFLDRVVPAEAVLSTAHDVARGFTTLDMKAHAATKGRLRNDLLVRLREAIDREFYR